MIQKTKRPISILLVLLMIVGMFTVLPISAGAAEGDYYIVGTMNSWNTADTTYQLTKNPENDAEYMLLGFVADANTEFKVVKNGAWEAPTNNFTLNDAGTYDIYFRPDGSGNQADGWKDGKVFAISSSPSPTYVAQIGETKYESLGEAFAAVQDGQTITLLANSTGGGIKVLENKFPNGVTLDFAGYTYTIDSALVGSPGYESQAFHLEKGNKFTFKNGTITSENAKMLVQNYSDLTLDGMTLTPNNPTYTNYYTLSNNNGNIVIKDTTINANPTANSYAFDVCRFSSYPSVHVTVTGESKINGDVEISASKGDAKQGFSLTLESGSMTGNIVVDASAQALVGEDNKVTKADTFTKDAPEGYKWVSNGDGTSSLAVANYVAQIGETKYESLGEAFAAVQDGQTITLLANSTGGGIKVLENKFPNGVTLDFAGYTYTIDSALVGSPGYESQAFHLEKGNKFTFKNGTITSENAKMLVQNYSDLTLDGMTLTPNNPTYTNYYTLSNNNGNIVIKDTTINANPTANSYAFDVCRFSSYPSVHVTVTGESKINGDVEISASKGDAKQGFSLTLESGSMTGNIVVDASAQALVGKDNNKVTKADTFNKTAPEGFKWVSNEDGTASLAPIPYVAKIGNTNYETLEAAFAAAQDGETITVLADCEGNGIKAPQGKFATGLTVDFDGHTYTVSGTPVGSTGTETIGFQLLKDNKITFKNGTITGNSRENEALQRMIQNYSDLTLDNMTVSMVGTYYNQITVSTCNGKTVIKDSTISAPDFTWAGYDNPAEVGAAALTVGTFSSYPSIDVTVEGTSVINGDVNVSDDNNKKAFSLTLNGGELNGKINLDENAKAAIDDATSTANVTKADTFTQEAPADYKWVSNEDGTASLAPIPYVAKIGETKYETLEAAFAAAVDGDTITVLTDCAGNGIKAPQGKFATGLTVDFAGHTYTVSGTPVGSSGTETIGFQLLKDNKITFQNGTITGNSNTNQTLMRMIQNYSDLTLDKMTVSMVGRYRDQITVSTCNGKTVINNSKISAPDYTWANITDPATVGAAALAVGTFSSYPSIDVTVEGTSVINGDVNVSDDNNKKAFSLTLNGGELNGKINLDENAKAAIDDTASTANVTKADTFTQAAPEGYEWKDNGNGTASLAKIVDLFAGYGLTLHGDIGLIFYLDPAAVGVNAADVSSVSVSFTCDKYTGTVTDFTREGDRIKVAYYVPAAYMASPVHAYSVTINGATSNETNDYSVQQYALRVIADPSLIANDETSQTNAVKLMKEMLNYGAKAKAVFQTQMSAPEAAVYATIPNYTMTTVTADMIDAAIEKEATDMSTVHPEPDANFYAPSVIYLSKTTLRMYFEIPTGKGSKNPDAYTGSQSNWYYWVDVTNIPAAELDEQQEFKVNGVTFYYSVLDYAKAVVAGGSSAQKDLAASLYLYNQAANAFFAD